MFRNSITLFWGGGGGGVVILKIKDKGNVLSYRWQQTFLDSILIKIIAKHNASKKNQEEKMELKAEVEKALKTLENETGHVSIQTFHTKQISILL